MGINLTTIIPCKDRIDNLKFCLASIRACSPRPRTIVVDFGSVVPLAFPEYKSWVQIIRVGRATELFHKARAINIGINHVITKHLCIIDADQIVQPNFFGVVNSILSASKNSFVMCKTHFLTTFPGFAPFDNKGKVYSSLLEQAKQSGIIPHGDGCCNGVSTKWAKAAHGYDESFVGYRAQDSDFALRAVIGGLQKAWIQNKTSMIHLPHSRVGDYYSSDHVIRNKEKYRSKAKKPIVRLVIANANQPWGKL